MRPEPEQYRAWGSEAVGALQRWYNPRTGLWKSAGWWNSANALTVVIHHAQRTGAVSVVVTSGLYFFSYGLNALRPLPAASGRVISPSFWRLFQQIGDHVAAPATINALIGVLWPLLLLALAWYLYNRLSPDVPAVLAATCALTFAWVLVAPWSLPWYTAVAWVTLALLPRNSLTRWLTLATGALALLHFNAGHPDNHPGAPTP